MNRRKGCSDAKKSLLRRFSSRFVFYGLSSGEYFLSGEKTNYLRIKSALYKFNDRTKIICLQTKSSKAAVLSTEELLRLGQKQEAAEVLRGLCCEPGSSEELFFNEYIAKLETKYETKLETKQGGLE